MGGRFDRIDRMCLQLEGREKPAWYSGVQQRSLSEMEILEESRFGAGRGWVDFWLS